MDPRNMNNHFRFSAPQPQLPRNSSAPSQRTVSTSQAHLQQQHHTHALPQQHFNQSVLYEPHMALQQLQQEPQFSLHAIPPSLYLGLLTGIDHLNTVLPDQYAEPHNQDQFQQQNQYQHHPQYQEQPVAPGPSAQDPDLFLRVTDFGQPDHVLKNAFFIPVPVLNMYKHQHMSVHLDRIDKCLLKQSEWAYCNLCAVFSNIQELPIATLVPEQLILIDESIVKRFHHFMQHEAWVQNFLHSDCPKDTDSQLQALFANVTDSTTLYQALYNLCYQVLFHKYIDINNQVNSENFKLSCLLAAKEWAVRITEEWQREASQHLEKKQNSTQSSNQPLVGVFRSDNH